jgi:hypothetical protein
MGMATTTGGSILVLRIKNNQSFSPLTLNLEKPYAVKVPKLRARRVLRPAMMMLFVKRFKYGEFVMILSPAS